MNSPELVNGQPSKFLYQEGCKALDGSVISHILARQEDYIVFICEDGAICWEHRDIPEHLYRGLEEYEKINAKIPSFLIQIHGKELKPILSTSLVAAFRSQSKDPNDIVDCFKPAWDFISEKEEINILYAGADYYIHVNSHKLIDIKSKESNADLDRAKIEALKLSSIAKHSLNEKQREKANRLIANDIPKFFENPTPKSFLSSKSFVDQATIDNAKINYIQMSLLFSVIFSVGLLSFYYFYSGTSLNLKDIALGSFAGVVGALVSILQRSNSLKPEPFSSVGLFAFEGVTRSILGVIFGALVVIATKANIALGLAGDSTFAIFILAFMAGINERFVPDLLEKNLKQ